MSTSFLVSPRMKIPQSPWELGASAPLFSQYKVFPDVQADPSVFQSVPIAYGPNSGHH